MPHYKSHNAFGVIKENCSFEHCTTVVIFYVYMYKLMDGQISTTQGRAHIGNFV